MLLALILAAQITNVADAADEKHPLEVDLEAGYVHARTQTKIARETTAGGGIQLNDELDHVRELDAVEMRLAVGLWHDLELHAFATLAIRDQQSWSPTGSVSTLASNTLNVSGCGGAGGCSTAQPILPLTGTTQRQGFFDPTVGIAWAPINEEREMRLRPELFPEGHAYATWALGVDYTLPIGNRTDDPSRFGFNTPGGNGAESRKAHVITAWTAFSKRYKVFEPYFKLSGSLPLAAKSAYDNCAHPELLSDVAVANCAGSWNGETGYKPPFEAGAVLGAELVVADTGDQRFSFDLRGAMTWHGPSRGYNQVSDALGKLTYADEYLTTSGSVGLYGRVARWFHMRVYGMLSQDSAHFLTHEDIGEDKNGDGKVTISEGTGVAAPDQNPNYDFRVDQPGRRLRAEPALTWSVTGTLSLNF